MAHEESICLLPLNFCRVTSAACRRFAHSECACKRPRCTREEAEHKLKGFALYWQYRWQEWVFLLLAARVSCKAETNVAKKVAAVSAALPAAIATHPAFALVRPSPYFQWSPSSLGIDAHRHSCLAVGTHRNSSRTAGLALASTHLPQQNTDFVSSVALQVDSRLNGVLPGLSHQSFSFVFALL